MEEFKILSAFNVIVFALIVWLASVNRIKWYIHLPLFMFYNAFFAYKFFYDGQYGQGFAWVFLNAFFSLLHFIILIVIFLFKKRKNRYLSK
jgi:hypothetical protein